MRNFNIHAMNKKYTLRAIYNLIVLLLVAAGAYLVVDHFVHFGEGEFTDNATICQHITPVNTRLQGFIKEIRFNEYQKVHKGDTLVIIEDSEYRLQLAQAEANLANALAGKEATNSSIETTTQNINVTDAGIDEARVQMENAQRDEQRYAQLLKDDAVTPQQYDQVHTTYLAAKARYERVSRSVNTLKSTQHEQGHRLNQNKAGIDAARAAVNLARLNLSYTIIVATCDGVMSRKDIHEGQLVQPGQMLARIVSDKEVWITANYRESQMDGIKIGNKVEFTTDALPGAKFNGVVESISAAAGSAYSMIPVDNATGNFVKVEQRVPVRIKITTNNDPKLVTMLRAGENADVNIEK